MKRTLWGVLHDEAWSMDVYDSRDQAEAARRSHEGGVLPLVRVTEEVVDVGDWTDLEPVRQRDEVIERVRALVERWDRLGSTLAAHGGAGIASVAVGDVVGDLRAALELEPTERCATCRCDTRYPTAVHVLDCGGSER